jgi:Na+/proline symporter
MRSNWALLVIGGLLGSVVGVIGASISDPEVGFPAWVDLTGVLAGFALGVLATGLLATLTRRGARARHASVRRESTPTPVPGRAE